MIKIAKGNLRIAQPLDEDALDPEAGPPELGPEREPEPEPVPSTREGPPPPAQMVPFADDEGEELVPQAEEPTPVHPVPQPPPPSDPEQFLSEVVESRPPSPEADQELSVREKIRNSLANGLPLRIVYTSLGGYTTERTVHPDYVYFAGTMRHVLVAWDELRNDWRAFIVDRIRNALFV